MKHKKFNQVYPYTYLVIRKSDNRKYHGVRYANVGKGLTPLQDLGVKYFTSSKLIKKDFKKNPHNYEFRVAWTFDTTEQAIDHEYKVNSRIFLREDWLNQSYGKNFGEHPNIGKLISLSRTPEVVKKGKESFKQFLKTEEGLNYRKDLSKRKSLFWKNKTHEQKLEILKNAHNSEKQKEILENLISFRKQIVDQDTGLTMNNIIAQKSAATRKERGLDSEIGFKRNQFYNNKLAAMTDEEFEAWCKGKSKRAVKGAETRRNKHINLQ